MGINAAGVAKASPSAWSTQSITLNANLAPGIFQGAFPAPCTPNPTKCSLARATSRWDFPAGTLLPHVFISNRIPNKTPSQLEFLQQLCSHIPTRCSSPCPPRTQILLYRSQKVPDGFLGSCRSSVEQDQAEGTAEFPFPPGFPQRKLHSGNLGTILCFHGPFIPGNFQVPEFQKTPRMA